MFIWRILYLAFHSGNDSPPFPYKIYHFQCKAVINFELHFEIYIFFVLSGRVNMCMQGKGRGGRRQKSILKQPRQ